MNLTPQQRPPEEHTRTPALTGGQSVALVVASLCIFIFAAAYFFVGFIGFH